MTQPSTTGQHAAINGAQLYYEIAGSGPALILLHAGIADNHMWDQQFPVFAQRYTVLRYDYRGFGQSSMPPGPYAPHDDLAALMRHLAIPRAHLIGVSMGGSLAIDFALTHPTMVGALIHVCGGLSGAPQHAEPDEIAYIQQIEAADAAGDTARINDLETHLWVDGLSRAPDQVDPTIRARIHSMNATILARESELAQGQPQPLDPPAYERLADLHAPILLIVGAQDMSNIHRVADTIVNGVSGARKVIIDNAAHVPNMEHPAEFNQLALDFLAQHPIP